MGNDNSYGRCETIRAARNAGRRTVKTLLFGVAMAVPFGIFLVALLFWHGASEREVAAPAATSVKRESGQFPARNCFCP